MTEHLSMVLDPKRPVLFVNLRSGGGRAARAELGDHARGLGVRCVVLERGGDLAALVRAAIASGADALGMAGGDGSMAVVAGAASAHDLPFVCVPAGTRNHFARDLGVARDDPVGALAAFTTGVERRIDLADVNGHVFVNNVSIGIYGDAVQRPGYRSAKLRTLLATAHEVLGPGATAPRLHILDDLGRDHTRPAVVLVSNNPYALEPPVVPGTRPRLDSGRLGIVVLNRPDEPTHRAARAWAASSLDVDAASAVQAGRDGEPVTLDPPLRFASRPGALRVRVSSSQASPRPFSGRVERRKEAAMNDGQDDALDGLSSPELHDLAVDHAKRHADAKFFRDLMSMLPVAEAGAGDLAESEDEVFDPGAHFNDVRDSGRGEVAELLRPFYLQYLREHHVTAAAS